MEEEQIQGRDTRSTGVSEMAGACEDSDLEEKVSIKSVTAARRGGNKAAPSAGGDDDAHYSKKVNMLSASVDILDPVAGCGDQTAAPVTGTNGFAQQRDV